MKRDGFSDSELSNIVMKIEEIIAKRDRGEYDGKSYRPTTEMMSRLIEGFTTHVYGQKQQEQSEGKERE